MFAITCDLTGATGYAGCACPDGHDANQLGHHPDECQLSDLHAIPGCVADCCDQHGEDDHDHEPQSCPTEHPAGSCPSPADCKMWRNMRSHVEDPDAAGMPCSGRILGRWFDLGLRRRHDRHPCVSRWLTGCW